MLSAPRRRFLAMAVGAAGTSTATMSRAAAPEPAGAVVLTVDGAIGAAGPSGAASYDLDALLALGRHRLQTRTPFTDGEPVFDGVLARRVMEAVDARGTRALAHARNDYVAEIPLSDFQSMDVLLASHMDGRRLTLRDKGPLWVVFPWSQHPEIDNRLTRQKSVWQLYRLSIS